MADPFSHPRLPWISYSLIITPKILKRHHIRSLHPHSHIPIHHHTAIKHPPTHSMEQMLPQVTNNLLVIKSKGLWLLTIPSFLKCNFPLSFITAKLLVFPSISLASPCKSDLSPLLFLTGPFSPVLYHWTLLMFTHCPLALIIIYTQMIPSLLSPC